MPHRGLELTSLPPVDQVAQWFLSLVYANIPLPYQPVSGKQSPKTDRNLEVCRLYSLGWHVPELATHFGISTQRVYQILKNSSKGK